MELLKRAASWLAVDSSEGHDVKLSADRRAEAILVRNLGPTGLPVYSDMTLKDDGTIVTGVWKYDPKTSYLLSGTRDGSHIKLDLKPAAKPDSAPVGSMDITIDTYADMFGSVTVGALTDMPFTAAQHSRIPPAVSDTPAPDESPYP